MIAPWIAFLAWVPISLYCFRRYPVRAALLFNFFAGWALLPSACFTPTSAVFPYWILGASLHSAYFLTKGSVTGLTCLLGIFLFDRKALSRCKLTLWDVPLLVWCAAPLLSGIANSQDLIYTLRAELYQCLAWGVPYFAGCLYFNSTKSLLLAAKAIVLAGMAYVPVCLLEIFTGPQIYAHLYGYEPYRWIGAQRYVGFRPIGLLEDGNQLGIWMASSALIAVWLWRHRLVQNILGIPIIWFAGALLMMTLLCQSIGSIVLLLGLLFFAFVRRSYLPKVLAALLVVGLIGSLGLRLSNIVSLRSLVAHNRAARDTAVALKGMKLGSLGWRLAEDEQHVATALKTPIVGSGKWDWWRASLSRPWSLWLLAFGMYGLVGLLALHGLQLLPVARVWRASLARSSLEGLEMRAALAAVLLMSAIDSLLNSSMILPLLLVIGGLSASTSTPEASRRDSAT